MNFIEKEDLTEPIWVGTLGDRLSPDGGFISVKKNGHLVCHPTGEGRNNHSQDAMWCNHMQTALEERWDAEHFWEAADKIDNCVMEIPMAPTLGGWQWVELEKHYPLGYKVYQLTDKSEDLIFLGFLLPGEGRLVIRSMLFDWWKGIRTNSDIWRCRSTNHNYQAQVVWENACKMSEASKLAQEWCTWKFGGVCAYCYGGAEDLGDLVPDVSDKKPSPFDKVSSHGKSPF